MAESHRHLAGHLVGQMAHFQTSTASYVPLMPAKTTPSEKSEFIEIREAAEWLGVPFSSLRKYVARGLLPSYKLGRHRLFRKPELLEALRQTTNATLDQVLR